jgi:hypothetical protein
LGGSAAAVDDAVVREVAATKNIAGDDARRLRGNDLAWSTISVRGYTLAEALERSLSSSTARSDPASLRPQFQTVPDPFSSVKEQRNCMTVKPTETCGPKVGAQRRPGVVGGSRWGRCGSGKLADRFFCTEFDIDSINRTTLAATPYVVYPSYAQVAAGMAAASATGGARGGSGGDGGGAGG